MVRQTIAICGEPKDDKSSVQINEEIIDIFREEQLSEQFLCEVNPLGQVPVLTSTLLSKAIADSVEITHFLADRYPSVIPASHKEQITELLDDLHAINYFSLSFPGREHVAEGFKNKVLKRLSGKVSYTYRDALTYKLGVLERDKIGGLKPGVPETMNERASALLEKFDSLLQWPRKEGSGEWLFGLRHPTALDMHLVTFIARMQDVGRHSIIPATLARYAERAMQTDAWQNVMQGRRTMIPKN